MFIFLFCFHPLVIRRIINSIITNMDSITNLHSITNMDSITKMESITNIHNITNIHRRPWGCRWWPMGNELYLALWWDHRELLLCAGKKERFPYSGKRVSFQYNGRASGVPIYLDTEAMSLSVITKVDWLWPKTSATLALINHSLFYTVRLVLSFERLLPTCMFLGAESS